MDPLTHVLTGVAMSRAGLNRWAPRPTLLMVLAANAPDIDVLTAAGGALNYLHYHRHITHSFVFLPALALATAGLVRLTVRGGFPWMRAITLAAIGVASHLLLDWTNIYGIRLLLPFSFDWYRLDSTSVIDIWIWVVLGIAWIWPFLSRLVSSEIGARPASGRGLAIAALCFIAMYDFGRWVVHRRVSATLEAYNYEGAAPLDVTAAPNAVNPLEWRGLVQTQAGYLVHRVSLLDPFDPTAGRSLPQAGEHARIEAARATETFRVFLNFCRRPLWRVTPTDEPENGTRVEAFDLRFGIPPGGTFTAVAILDSEQRVLDSWFSFRGGRR